MIATKTAPAELATHWPTPNAWPIPGWLASGRAIIVKQGTQRTVYRVELPGCVFFLKQHHLPDSATWLRQCLRPAKAKAEFDNLRELTRRGIAVPEPLGWGQRPGPLGVGESFLLTRALTDVVSLDVHLNSGSVDDPRTRQLLANDLARFIARLHDAGVRHDDLHSGNILVRVRDDAHLFCLVDLDAVRLGAPLDRGESLAALARFTSALTPWSNRADRLRFLRAYVEARGWIDAKADLAGPRSLFMLAREIEAEAWSHNLRFWANRDRRCFKTNRYYRRVKLGSVAGHVVRSLDGDWLRRLLEDPDALFADAVRMLKDSKSSTVAEIEAPAEDGGTRSLILKRVRVTRRSDPLTSLVRQTPATRSWLWGQGFLERGLPTPRPLAVLHRRRHGMLHEGYILTELVPDAQELQDYVADLRDPPAEQGRGKLLRQLERVARAIRELHRRDFSHRDLKAANLLVTSLWVEDTPAGAPRLMSGMSVAANRPLTTNLWFIDLVGVRLHKRLGKRRRAQNLARLNVSFLNEPMVSLSDRLRFLRVYLGWGIHGKGDWKSWWRAIAAATVDKVARNKKSGRVLA